MIKVIGNGAQLSVDGAEGYFPEEFIVRAVAKQLPKKPEYEGDGDYAICPVCGLDNFEYGINNWGCNYCPKCGQALDWSDK